MNVMLKDLVEPVAMMQDCHVALTAVYTSRAWEMAATTMDDMNKAMENYDMACQHVKIHARPPKAKAKGKAKGKAKASAN